MESYQICQATPEYRYRYFPSLVGFHEFRRHYTHFKLRIITDQVIGSARVGVPEKTPMRVSLLRLTSGSKNGKSSQRRINIPTAELCNIYSNDIELYPISKILSPELPSHGHFSGNTCFFVALRRIFHKIIFSVEL